MLSLKLADIDVERDYRIEWPDIVEDIKKTGFKNVYGRHRRKDGSTFPVEVNARYINLNRGYMVAVVRDITERKRLETRFRRLVDSNAQGVFFWNTEGEIIGGNDAFLKLVRYTREDLEAGLINWAQMTPPEYAERDRKAMDECAELGVCQSYEKEFILKDGSRVPLLLGAAVFEDNPNEGVCFVLDLTERKKLEQQFLRAQRMESIGTLAGGIAHDLNNVLAPITMSIDLLKMKFTDKGSQELLATLGSSAQRGAEMVRQVLSFARGVEGRKMDVQVKHLVQDIEKIAIDTFPKNIQVRSIVPSELSTILGDPTQLHQVLLNFSVNARDAMPNGGILTISAENVHLDDHYAGLNPDAHPGAYVFLQIADTGTGMPPGVIEKIFDPFFTTKEIGKGTGLGLSTSLAIVKSHGGFIRVYSEPGKGTTFKAYFPAQTKPSAQTAGEVAAELPRGNGELILVVDDEASVRVITRQTLEAFGYRVVLASDGAEAVAIFARQGAEIAVVLTDMMMPVMDGPATIQVLLRLNPELPIIAASGLSADGRVTQAASLGVKHFLSKPSSADALLQVLRQILSAKSA
jgi:PAS domain S-box-containing protein